MRSKDTYLRLQRFRFEERRRQVLDIEAMIADFRRKQEDLDLQVANEEHKNGVSDPNHFNYSMTAKSLRGRRENMARSMAELKTQLDDARTRLVTEQDELRKLELLSEKEGGAVSVAQPAPAEGGVDDASRYRHSLS